MFPTQLSKTGGNDLRHYAGNYLVYYYATNARTKIVRGFLRIGLRSSGKNLYKLVRHCDMERDIELEGYLFPLANNHLCFLMENVERPEEIGFSMIKKATSTNVVIPPHFVALSCFESMSIESTHVPTAYRELYIRYDGDEPPDDLGLFERETLGTIDPNNPDHDAFFLRKLRPDFYGDYPYLQIFPKKDSKRLGKGKLGFQKIEYTREIEFLVKVSPESRARHIARTLPETLGQKLKDAKIPGDVRVFRRNMDESVLTVSVSFFHESPRSFRIVCDLIREECSRATRQDGAYFHELLFSCRTHDEGGTLFSAPCRDEATLDIPDAYPDGAPESSCPDDDREKQLEMPS